MGTGGLYVRHPASSGGACLSGKKTLRVRSRSWNQVLSTPSICFTEGVMDEAVRSRGCGSVRYECRWELAVHFVCWLHLIRKGANVLQSRKRSHSLSEFRLLVLSWCREVSVLRGYWSGEKFSESSHFKHLARILNYRSGSSLEIVRAFACENAVFSFHFFQFLGLFVVLLYSLLQYFRRHSEFWNDLISCHLVLAINEGSQLFL